MRRKDKEIKDGAAIRRIIDKAGICRLGLCRDNVPYIVPVCFGFDGKSLYFHTAREGMKIDYIAANNRVCFELEDEVEAVSNEIACEWSFSFYSVIGFGTVEELTDPTLQARALGWIMKHYSNREWDFSGRSFENIRVWRIHIDQMTGKKSKDKPLPLQA